MLSAAVARSVSGLLLYPILSVLASLCFKECGTDAEHTWSYSVAGNVLGAFSLILIMWVYAGMNANLAGALLMGIGSIAVQGADHGRSPLFLPVWASRCFCQLRHLCLFRNDGR